MKTDRDGSGAMGERRVVESGGHQTPVREGLRAGDEDRRVVVAALQRHFVAGRLTDAELGERVRLALAARTFGELDALGADLPRLGEPGPAPAARPVAQPVPRRATATPGDVRAHAFSYLAVMALLVAIWLLTTPGGYFWPVWPMLGWGIGVVSHATGRKACGRRVTLALSGPG